MSAPLDARPEKVSGGTAGMILAAVDHHAGDLVGLSHSLHQEPELGLAEHLSAEKAANVLGKAGFDVERGSGGLPTAFVARYGQGDFVVALCIEYDALPGIGHACGHNVNGAAAVGAALGLAAVADALGITIKAVGTPAEETVGGKIPLLEAGVFDDAAIAMMVHAGGRDEVGCSSYALTVWEADFAGAPAHAASAPWLGINAADAVTLAYQAVALLRQQLPAGNVVSFVIREAGGAPNVIPASARAVIEMRAPTRSALRGLQDSVRRCLEAGGHATGAALEVRTRGGEFAELRQDADLTRAYVDSMRALGREPIDLGGAPHASTDMGNVSHLVPSIHPTIGYDVAGAAHHTAGFTERGTSPSADLAVLDGARGLAMAAAAIAADPRQRSRLLASVADRA